MRESLFGHLRAMAWCSLLLIAWTALMTLGFCATGSEGTIGTAGYLDAICPLEEPRALYDDNPLSLVLNRVAMPGVLGVLLLLCTGGLAILFTFAFPKEQEAPDYDWPGKSTPKPQKRGHGGRPEW